MIEENKQIYKIILIGDCNVGKSQILKKYSTSQFDENPKITVGVEFITKKIYLDNKTCIKAQIWDTSGEEKYQAITSAYYKGALGCIIVYDITNRVSYENVNKWLKQIQETAGQNILIMLVGNKCDLQNRKVVQEEAFNFSKENKIAFLEASALTGQNINNIFDLLVKGFILLKRNIWNSLKQNYF